MKIVPTVKVLINVTDLMIFLVVCDVTNIKAINVQRSSKWKKYPTMKQPINLVLVL